MSQWEQREAIKRLESIKNRKAQNPEENPPWTVSRQPMKMERLGIRWLRKWVKFLMTTALSSEGAPCPNSESVKIGKAVRYVNPGGGEGDGGGVVKSHRWEARTRVEKDPGCKNGWAPCQEGCERKECRALGGKSRTLTGGGSAWNGGHGNSAIYSIIGR